MRTRFTMTTNLSAISELRDAMNILYPQVQAYYKIKNALESIENTELNSTPKTTTE